MVEAEARMHDLTSRLRERGYRVTPQRAAVLKVLTERDNHPTVEQIYESVRIDFPMTSLATVYKTLAVLKEVGAVCELRIDGGGTRYDGCRNEPHPHLICVRCGEITDLDIAPIGGTIEEVEIRTGYRVVSHRHNFFGTCPDCRGDGEDQSKR
jgi:Fur family peroxide stress response transcriptional regulator